MSRFLFTPHYETLSAAPATADANVMSARELYPEAAQIAGEWKPDAYLIRVHTIGSKGTKPATHLYYLFYSPKTPYIALELKYDADSGTFTDGLFPASKLAPDETLVILSSDWEVDSVEALEIAQSHGGAVFLGQWQAFPSLILEKEKAKAEYGTVWRTVWRISYFDPVARKSMCFRISAESGEVPSISTE